eukprot:3821618-Pyramimonas_sp.AAC.1
MPKCVCGLLRALTFICGHSVVHCRKAATPDDSMRPLLTPLKLAEAGFGTPATQTAMCTDMVKTKISILAQGSEEFLTQDLLRLASTVPSWTSQAAQSDMGALATALGLLMEGAMPGDVGIEARWGRHAGHHAESLAHGWLSSAVAVCQKGLARRGGRLEGFLDGARVVEEDAAGGMDARSRFASTVAHLNGISAALEMSTPLSQRRFTAGAVEAPLQDYCAVAGDL